MAFRGDRLRECRQEHGYSQEGFSEAINVALRQIPRYEANETSPSADVVSRMAEVLGVTSDYLLGLVDEPTKHLSREPATPEEWQLLVRYRDGKLLELIRELTEQAIANQEQKPPVIGEKPEI